MTRITKAVQDGQAIRKKVTGRVKRPGFAMTPDEVVATINKHIRQTMGDAVENGSVVYARNGYFYILVHGNKSRITEAIADKVWRDMLRDGVNLRRVSVALAIRAMHGAVLTGE